MSRPALEGRTVAVLRVESEDDAVVRALEARGATAIVVTVGRVEDRDDAHVVAGVGELGRFAWVAVTSAHAARRLALWSDGWPPSTRVGVVGDATAAAVARAGRAVDAVAPDGTAASLAGVLDGGPVLFLAASSARTDLARGLAARGIDVETVVAYDVVARALDVADAGRVAAADAVVALSPRAIDALCELADDARAQARRVPLVVIGPTTEAHALERELAVARRAVDRGAASVADAVCAVVA